MTILRLVLAMLLVCAATPSAAGWSCADTATFRLCAQGGARDTGLMATRLATFDTFLRRLTGTGPPGKTARVTLFVVDSGTFDALRGLGPGYDGFYTATPAAISAFIRRTPRLQATMFHEYAHHFMFANLPGSYPAWYIEGLASYLETARFGGGLAVYGDFDRSRANTLVFRSWMPMTRVLDSDWTTLPGYETPLFYAQSWLAVHYLSRDPARAAALARYLAAVAAGTPAATAFRDTFGYPLERFDRVLMDYVASSALTMTQLPWTWTPPAIAVTELDRTAGDVLLPAAQLGIGVDARQCATLLARVRDIAARAPGDRAAAVVRITAELRCGDRTAVDALIDAQLAAAPGDADLLMLRGLVDLADHRSAIATLAAADAARPDDYRILYLRALAQPRPFDAESRALLLRAHRLAPQVEAVTLAAAQAAHDGGDIAATRALLTPVAQNPHGGEGAARAARALEALPK